MFTVDKDFRGVIVKNVCNGVKSILVISPNITNQTFGSRGFTIATEYNTLYLYTLEPFNVGTKML